MDDYFSLVQGVAAIIAGLLLAAVVWLSSINRYRGLVADSLRLVLFSCAFSGAAVDVGGELKIIVSWHLLLSGQTLKAYAGLLMIANTLIGLSFFYVIGRMLIQGICREKKSKG